MSKMGKTIMAVQELCDRGVEMNLSHKEIMSQISNQYGDMFTAIAEEYYGDLGEPDYEPIHDVDSFEDLCEELGIEETSDKIYF